MAEELSSTVLNVAAAVARFGALVANDRGEDAERYIQAVNRLDNSMPMRMAVAMAGVLATTLSIPGKSFQLLADALPGISDRERVTLRTLGDKVDGEDPQETYQWWCLDLTADERGGLLTYLALHVGAAMVAARQLADDARKN